MAYKRKLIEVAIPLAAINAAAETDGPKRKGHPWRLHYWWARRKLVVARAVLFAQIVDDPSSREEEFRLEASDLGGSDLEAAVQRLVIKERDRLFDLIVRMVDRRNIDDQALFDEVRLEIERSTGGNPPVILDPFAGGGTIPLEAQRLGLEAHASDLNPVAVLINKALIEIPSKFTGQPPVFPGAAGQRNGWPRATGLAEDVRRYGAWVREAGEQRLGELYPSATQDDGTESVALAWIWARTVTCPNPACAIEMPLVRSWWLGRKKGKEAFVLPRVEGGSIQYVVSHETRFAPTADNDGTMSGRTGATCISCGTAVPVDYIRGEGVAGRLRERLLATVIEGNRRRIYLSPTPEQELAAAVEAPADAPTGELADNPRWFSPPAYGLKTFASIFTNRQLTVLTGFSDLVTEARERAFSDALDFGLPEGDRLEQSGTGAAAYADAVAVYLGLALSRGSDYMSSLTSWHNKNEQIRNVFARQAIPMVWDFLESNFLGTSAGSWTAQVTLAAEVLDGIDLHASGTVNQVPAQDQPFSNGELISTDPPYYDNVGYSDLSDFFYVWLRRSLQGVLTEGLSTMLVPKSEELVANPYRHGGKLGAKKFFEDGFGEVFDHARKHARDDYPITVYYAFKQEDDSGGGVASTGWETLLQAMVRGGWSVTATWPFRTETGSRLLAQGTNALASSVVLALRPRPAEAPTTDRRGFIAALKRELAPALRDLQSGGIAPVDLPQAAIGPGMAVFSRYSSVIESDGSPMPVRAALAHINEMLDEVLTEQEGDFDPTTRFALAWYRGHGYESSSYGDAEDLARARGTAVVAMERSGILTARAGRVQLYRPADLTEDYDVLTDAQTSAWEALHHAIRILDSSGITAAGAFLQTASQRTDGAVDLDLVKELAYLLFQIAEKSGWSKDAQSFNDIATSWGDLLQAERPASISDTSVTLDFEEDQ